VTILHFPQTVVAYVGCDDGANGRIITLDLVSRTMIADALAAGVMGGHPELIKYSPYLGKLVAACSDVPALYFIDTVTKAYTKLTIATYTGSPVAFDILADINAIAATFRHATNPRVIIFDLATYLPIANISTVMDTDDIFYDSNNKRIFAIGDNSPASHVLGGVMAYEVSKVAGVISLRFSGATFQMGDVKTGELVLSQKKLYIADRTYKTVLIGHLNVYSTFEGANSVHHNHDDDHGPF